MSSGVAIKSRSMSMDPTWTRADVAAILKAYPQVEVKIGGYTDNSADGNYNLKLSQDRANAALTQIVDLGIDRSGLAAEGYGERHPSRQRDRRGTSA